MTDQAKVGKVDLGTGKAQHVDLWRKLKLRRELLAHAGDGPAYVPFLGEGDIADALYVDREIYGVELDPDVADTARRKLPAAHIVTGNAEGPVSFNPEIAFAIADVDAFSNPYKAIELFWREATKADQVVLFGTDGMRLAIRQSKTRVFGPLPEGKIESSTLAAKRRQWNGWWGHIVRPYLEELVAPGRIVVELKYLRAHMLYWGVVVDRRAMDPLLPAGDDASGPAGDDASRLETSDGSPIEAPKAPTMPATAPSEAGAPDDIAKVEAALLEAAQSGNVSAAIFWLEHKGGPTWSKPDPIEMARRLTRPRRSRD